MYPQHRLIHFVLVVLLLYSLVSFCSNAYELQQARALEDTLGQELRLLEQDNALKKQRLEDGITEQELMQLARQRLGLVLPGEKIFYFTTDREA